MDNTLKFIRMKLKHRSTRKDDRARLYDCMMTLTAGLKLDLTQQGFISALREEERQRTRQYYLNRKARKANGI